MVISFYSVITIGTNMKSFNEYNHEQHAYDKQRKVKENKTQRKGQKQNLKHLVDSLGDDVDDDDYFDDDLD